ncbi:MAG: hypothetical protein Q9187_004254, partial [Circinaria calcarea]
MEPLSVAASIAGIISLADIVIERLFHYIQNVKDAKKQISALLQETSNLGGVLRSLEMLARQFETEQLQTQFQTHHINACFTTLDRLDKLLGGHNPSKTPNMLKSLKHKLSWPLSKSDAEEFLEELERHKSTLSLALEADGFSALLQAISRHDTSVRSDIKDIKGDLVKLHSRYDIAEEFVTSHHQQKILDFFGRVDPRKHQRSNLGLLHPGTGLWFTEGEDFKLWYREKNAKLWITGIPGAGKTILIAHIIQTLQKPSVEDNAIAYFYCDYKDSATHDPATILGSLAKQFAYRDETAFSKLECFYNRYNVDVRTSTLPALEELRDLISALAECFDNALVVVDGLDECSGDRSIVVGLLTSLMDVPRTNIKCIFASRDEYDIGICLKDYVKVSIAAKGTDLKLYVLAEIEKRTKSGRLSIRRPALKEEIMAKLVEKADGMFRWVACQIDYMCELSSDKERREALDSLPPTLPKTYERILRVVNKNGVKNQSLVRRTLHWLAGAKTALTVAALIEALSVSPTTRELDEDSLIDENAIIRLCSSFIRRSADQDIIELAHFTVKEFLLAISEGDAEFSAYRFVPIQAHLELSETCLRYLCLNNFSNGHPETVEELSHLEEEHPFLNYASWFWFWDYHARPHLDKDPMRDLIHELFRPMKSYNFIVWALEISVRAAHRSEDFDGSEELELKCRFDKAMSLISESSVLHWSCLLGLLEATQWLLEVKGLKPDKETALGHPIHFVIGSIESLCLYIKEVYDMPGFQVPLGDRPKIISILIELHVDLNFSTLQSGTPLSLAFSSDSGRRNGEFPMTKMLLEAGVAFSDDIFSKFHKEYIEHISNSEEFRLKDLFDFVSDNSIEVSHREWFVKKAIELNASCALSELESTKASINAIKLGCYRELLSSAIEADSLDVVKELLDYGANVNDESGSSPLHLAAASGSTQMLTMLAQRIPDIDAINHKGETPIMTAAAAGNSCTLQTILDLALEKNIVLRRTALDGRSVLHYAAQGGSWEIIERILGHFGNDDVYKMTPEGLSCLDLAVQAQCSQAVRVFLELKLDATTRRNGTTTLHIAVKSLKADEGLSIVK